MVAFKVPKELISLSVARFDTVIWTRDPLSKNNSNSFGSLITVEKEIPSQSNAVMLKMKICLTEMWKVDVSSRKKLNVADIG